jgi:hypothetical protein
MYCSDPACQPANLISIPILAALPNVKYNRYLSVPTVELGYNLNTLATAAEWPRGTGGESECLFQPRFVPGMTMLLVYLGLTGTHPPACSHAIRHTRTGHSSSKVCKHPHVINT